jgi:hypothetical protein
LIDSSNVTIVDIHQVFKARFNPIGQTLKAEEAKDYFDALVGKVPDMLGESKYIEKRKSTQVLVPYGAAEEKTQTSGLNGRRHE